MISVIMPVYNGEKFLRPSIESILNQTEKNFELIIVNDGSTDSTEEIILSYEDSRINYLKQENGGDAAARNKALAHIKGNFVTFQDADDISLPMRFEVLKQQFTSSSVGFAHSDFLLIDEQNQPIGYWASGNIDAARMRRFFLKVGTPFNNPSMMVRRAALEGFLYDTSQRLGSDSDMVFYTTGSWTTVHTPLPLVLYRRHTSNLSKKQEFIVLYPEVRKFLNNYSLQELVPELAWEKDDPVGNEAKARAIIALFLLRRGMVQDCQAWYEKAYQLKNPACENFVTAIGHLLTANYAGAIQALNSSSVQDAIVLNYLGESYALQGDLNKAFAYYLRALQINPNYEEPLDNLKAIGWKKGLSFIDSSWTKFS